MKNHLPSVEVSVRKNRFGGKMYAKLLILVIAVCMQSGFTAGQRQWVNPQTTAEEMRNPYTWYSPYYQAAAEAYAKYYRNAQDIRDQLWQQAYATGAFGGNYGQGRQNYPRSPYGQQTFG